MKRLFKSYGYFTVATYLGVYVITLGGLYVTVKAGAVTPPDVNGWINNWRVKKALYEPQLVIPENYLDFATAWVLTKTTEPIRLVVTIALVPILVRRLPPRVLSLFGAKPPPPNHP